MTSAETQERCHPVRLRKTLRGTAVTGARMPERRAVRYAVSMRARTAAGSRSNAVGVTPMTITRLAYRSSQDSTVASQ